MSLTYEVAKLAELSRQILAEATSKKTRAAPQRNIHRRLPPQAIDELPARHMAGEETPALSREFGISSGSANRPRVLVGHCWCATES